MATPSDIVPFEAALADLQRRGVVPTSLTSAELRKLGAEFHRNNFTSAQTLLEDLLTQYKSDVEKIINPQTQQRSDRITADNPQGNVSVGLNPTEARVRAKELLKKFSYAPSPEDAGTIKDLSSDPRINLVVKTNRDVSQGAGWFIQSQAQAVLDAFPAQELVRIEARKEPRNWNANWRLAASISGDTDALRVLETTGRMIARKDSPIWLALGELDGGLGNPFPPFAFGSGMGVRDIGYSMAVQLQLVKPGEKIEPQELNIENLFGGKAVAA